jgi:uncharacterized protein YjbJ (UPF0337 family)
MRRKVARQSQQGRHGCKPLQNPGEKLMNQDIIKGQWAQLKGSLKSQWGKLTDDDLSRADGNHQYLVGRLQERYGWQKDQAEREIRDFERNLQKKAA